MFDAHDPWALPPGGEPPRFDDADDPTVEWAQWWSARPGARPEHRLARTQGFVLLARQLPGVGVTRAAARHRVASGCWGAAAHGAVTPFDLDDDGADVWTLARRAHAVRAAAAALRRPGHVVSGNSAAILAGLPTLDVPETAEITDADPDGLGRRAGAHLFGASITAQDVTRWWGVPVTIPERTVVDLARHSRRAGIVAADAALRAGLVTAAELDRVLEDARGWPGVRTAREIVALADARAESPLESIVRLLMHDDGMPRPEPQHRIAGYRVDLALLDQRVVVEADGRVKYTGDAGWREKERQEAVARQGWRVERMMWSDTTNRGWTLARERLWSAIRRLPSRPNWS
ncbi:hypothetical protein GCM10027265_06370 [Jatrophihabitans fulvus]